jgi:hypothetical protein
MYDERSVWGTRCICGYLRLSSGQPPYSKCDNGTQRSRFIQISAVQFISVGRQESPAEGSKTYRGPELQVYVSEEQIRIRAP